MTSRWSQLTYSSFGRAGGSGWGFGPSVNLQDGDIQLAQKYVRGDIWPVQKIDDFLNASEVAELPARFEYIPLPGRGGEHKSALYVQTVPAGRDGSGRQGNSFTHILINHDVEMRQGGEYPIAAFRSPDLLTPFLSKNVDAVELAQLEDVPRRNPSFNVEFAWTLVREMGEDRFCYVLEALDAISGAARVPVLLVENAQQAFIWLSVISSLTSPDMARQQMRLSTFERAASFDGQNFYDDRGRVIVAAPVEDKKLFALRDDVHCIDTTAPPREYAPQTVWSECAQWVFDELGSVAALLVEWEKQPASPLESLGRPLEKVRTRRENEKSNSSYQPFH